MRRTRGVLLIAFVSRRAGMLIAEKSWRLFASAAALLILSARDFTERFGPPEERINAAVPVHEAVSVARSKVEQLLSTDADKRRFAGELKAKEKLRALTCAAGFEPSMFDSAEAIRRRLTNRKCFEDFDTEEAQWLKLRRVRLLLTSPPLRPVPKQPPAILTASGSINSVSFARNAGVALVSERHALEIIDVGSDRSIYIDREFVAYTNPSLSPNGRVFVAATRPYHEGVMPVLRDSETGEALAEFPDYSMFEWLDGTIAWVSRERSAESELLDLATGKTSPVKGIASKPTQLLPAPGTQHRFVARSHGVITRFDLHTDGAEPRIVLEGQQTVPYASWSGAQSTLTSDGQFFVQGAGKLLVSDLTTQQTEEISLQPYSSIAISPLPKPLQVLLSAGIVTSGRITEQPYVFDLSDHTFTPIEDDRFMARAGVLQPRTVYVPSMNRVALVKEATITFVDDMKLGFKLGLPAFIQQMQEKEQAVRAQALAEASRYATGAQSLAYSSGVPSATGNIAELAKDAHIEAVGVYRSAGAPSRPGQPAGRGSITVVVRPSTHPLILVLTSYDPVDWRVMPNARATIKAILLASYGESTVQGSSARLLRIGSMYAYDRGSTNFAGLQREVVRWTGKAIDTLQGTYKASVFTVGGLE